MGKKHSPSLQQALISESYSTPSFFSEQVCKKREAGEQLPFLNMSVGTLSDQPCGCRDCLLIESFFSALVSQKLTSQFKFCPNSKKMECKECVISRLVYGLPAQEEETFQQSKESKKFT